MSRFVSNPDLGKPIPGESDFSKDFRPWVLRGALVYESDHLGGIITVHKGYRTDFASVPWLFRRVFPKDGPWTQAAIVHDFLCDSKDPNIDHKAAAVIFGEAMEVLHVPAWKRRAMVRAVLHFGPKWT